mmetsp:Transcript_29925/g.54244  ORF Transcript_29925/g.54244 Transcript_29925/m.54244 type:complete len:238 (-) Transcript_29925:1008-1721(-)
MPPPLVNRAFFVCLLDGEPPPPPPSSLDVDLFKKFLMSLEALLPLAFASSITRIRLSFWIFTFCALSFRVSTISAFRLSMESMRLSPSWICRNVSSLRYSWMRLMRFTFSSFMAIFSSFFSLVSMWLRSRASFTRITFTSSSTNACRSDSMRRSSSLLVCASTMSLRCSMSSCCLACNSRSRSWAPKWSSRSCSWCSCFAKKSCFRFSSTFAAIFMFREMRSSMARRFASTFAFSTS